VSPATITAPVLGTGIGGGGWLTRALAGFSLEDASSRRRARAISPTGLVGVVLSGGGGVT